MIKILHISADYPDAVSSRKTHAVRNLVVGAESFDCRVYSINRRNGLGGLEVADRDDRTVSLTYAAPPYGVMLEPFLIPLADWILMDTQAAGWQPDVIHAHKLTVEGLIAQRLAEKIGCAYICSVRGKTDQLYLRAKPGKVATFRRVARGAARLLPITPWIRGYLSAKLGVPLPHAEVLPTVTETHQLIPPEPRTEHFVTAFHLDAWRPKGMPRLFSAMCAVGENVSLDIIGGGAEPARRALDREIERRGLADRVRLVGPVDHADMQRTLNCYTALVMPTLQETFGMVYIEALFSGVPILYSQGRAVDGFFDDVNVGYRCNPNSVRSIADGLDYLRGHESELKENILKLQEEGCFDRFMKPNIIRKYEEIIRSVHAG